jgi:hypothetical protein
MLSIKKVTITLANASTKEPADLTQDEQLALAFVSGLPVETVRIRGEVYITQLTAPLFFHKDQGRLYASRKPEATH